MNFETRRCPILLLLANGVTHAKSQILAYSSVCTDEYEYDMIYLLIKHKYIQRHTRKTRIAGGTRLKTALTAALEK